MAEEPSLSYYLPIAGGRIIGFIPFPRVLVLCEMQSVSSRIWTRIAVFLSYGDNDYTTVAGKFSTCVLDLRGRWAYIYIYIIALKVRKKPGKWFEDENIQRITAKGKIYIYWKKIYFGKKRKDQPCHTNWKKSRHALGWSKEKNTVKAAKLQCKKRSILNRAK